MTPPGHCEERFLRRSNPFRQFSTALDVRDCFVAALLAMTVGMAFPPRSSAEETPGNRFVYTVLKHDGNWDPYGDLWPDVAARLDALTSVKPWPSRRVAGWDDAALFASPFILLTGRGALSFSESDLSRLRDYLSGGGFLLIDNAEGERGGAFDRSAASLPAALFPGWAWKDVPADDAVFRSFFLMRKAAGRRMASETLKGLWVQDRLAAVYCPNDLQGAWVRAPAGGYLFPCEPGGEVQRREAQKLLVNLIVFSLTGTYKTDAIHQEFIKRKLEP
jgi:hypothetical protein